MDKLLVKFSKRIGVLRRIRSNLHVDSANKVYQSLVFPVMDYCDVSWCRIGKIERDKLDRAQRRAAKIVLKTKDSDAEKNLLEIRDSQNLAKLGLGEKPSLLVCSIK